jgi:hypothetical protein
MKSAFFFEVLQEDLDLIAFLERLGVLELVEGNRSLGLEADVEDDGILGDAKDLRLDDLSFDDLRHRALVHREHLLVVFVGICFVVEVLPDAETAGGGELIGRGLKLLKHSERTILGLCAAPDWPRAGVTASPAGVLAK